MKVINLFAGAGAGKSTTAAGLFFKMKTAQMSVELVTEYAKELVWQRRGATFADQLYILGKQHHRVFTLRDQVNFVISDSPLLLSNIYCPKNFIPGFNNFVNEVFKSFDNVNFYINRVKPYNPKGRNEDEAGARKKDAEIKDYLLANKVPFIEIAGDDKAPENIFKMLTVLPKEMLDQAANLHYR